MVGSAKTLRKETFNKSYPRFQVETSIYGGGWRRIYWSWLSLCLDNIKMQCTDGKKHSYHVPYACISHFVPQWAQCQSDSRGCSAQTFWLHFKFRLMWTVVCLENGRHACMHACVCVCVCGGGGGEGGGVESWLICHCCFDSLCIYIFVHVYFTCSFRGALFSVLPFRLCVHVCADKLACNCISMHVCVCVCVCVRVRAQSFWGWYCCCCCSCWWQWWSYW